MWKKRLGALALSAALALSLAVPALAAEDTAPAETAPLTREESAAQAAAYAAQYGGASAISYAVWEDWEITLSGHAGVYSKTENRAILDDDLYGVGSVSKIYTTVAVMQLVEDGKINLDSPVTKYLPDFKMADERYKDITVRMLLNHSSGLMGTSNQNFMLFADDDRSAAEDLLERLSTQRLKADPGAFSVYCNDGFTLAELVVEAVSGKSFPAYLRTEIFEPAGLQNTFAPQDEFDASRLVRIYQGADTRALPQDCLGTVGTGGIYSSASDLAAFGGALTGKGLLSEKSLKAMAAPEYKNGVWAEDDEDQVTYGLGWDAVKYYPFAWSDIQALAKGGDTLYYHAGLVVIPEYNMAAAVLSSGGVSTYNEMAASRMLIDALAEKGVSVDETLPALPAAESADMPAELADYSGYYGSNAQQMKIDVTADGVLTIHSLTYPSTPAQTFAYFSDGSFRDAAGAAMMKFVEETNGVTYLYQKACASLPGLGLMPVSNYAAQKMPENSVSAEAQASWDRMGTMGVVLLSEKYTSQLWPALFSSNGMTEMPKMVPGYYLALRIVDGANARGELQVPNGGGRDSQDMTIYEKDGVTYIATPSQLLMDAAQVKPVFAGEGAYSTIQADGYARWYEVGAAAGMTMSVTLPEEAGFYVYHADGSVAASSVMYGDASVALPEGGYIVFIGDPGARFHLSFTRPAA